MSAGLGLTDVLAERPEVRPHACLPNYPGEKGAPRGGPAPATAQATGIQDPRMVVHTLGFRRATPCATGGDGVRAGPWQQQITDDVYYPHLDKHDNKHTYMTYIIHTSYIHEHWHLALHWHLAQPHSPTSTAIDSDLLTYRTILSAKGASPPASWMAVFLKPPEKCSNILSSTIIAWPIHVTIKGPSKLAASGNTVS